MTEEGKGKEKEKEARWLIECPRNKEGNIGFLVEF
jgi:hypothetical protein